VAQMTIEVDDEKWPRIRMIVTRKDESGQVHVTKHEQQFDTAYTAFEPHVHNHLAPLVEDVINRRMKSPATTAQKEQ
jgi:hypothetical protein